MSKRQKVQAPGQRCIFKERPIEGKGFGSTALCDKGYQPFILDLEHAEGCISSGSYVYPCPKCLKIARKNAQAKS